ncbi:MAG: methyltransferase domain-containing protein [Bacteroidota bacterium]
MSSSFLGSEERTASNKAAWDRAAATYADDIEQDVAFLEAGGVALLDAEQQHLGNLADCGRVIHLQCSHGLDALSLLNLGAAEAVGVDISGEMLAQAEEKTRRLGAKATWVHADVLAVPDALDGSADLVYTGKGALPWVSDLDRWAHVVKRLLRPGGRLYVFEGHPLNWIWDPDASTHDLRSDGRGYFDPVPRANDHFPAAAVARFTPAGETIPTAWEYQWTLGETVSAVARAGLFIEHVEEHPFHFWPQFETIPPDEHSRLPHTFALLARKQ